MNDSINQGYPFSTSFVDGLTDFDLKSIYRGSLVPGFILTMDQIPDQWWANHQYQLFELEDLILIVRKSLKTYISAVCVSVCVCVCTT